MVTNNYSNEQKLAMLQVMAGIMEVIGQDGIPNGHLYAFLMGKVSLERYQSILSAMKQMGLVAESGYYLTLTDKGKEFVARMN